MNIMKKVMDAFRITHIKSVRHLFVILLFLTAVFGIYGSTLTAPMQYDDLELLLHNPVITNPAAGLSHLKFYARKTLTLATFAVNFYLHRERTFGYHLVNTFLHLLAGICLWRALLCLFQAPWFRERNEGGWDPDLFAVFATLIFLVHPLQTQAVSYIWQRSEVLSGLFYALVLWCYWKGRTGGGVRFMAGSVLLCVIGLFAKGTIVTAPLLLGLSEILFFDGDARLKERGWKRNLRDGTLAALCVTGCFLIGRRVPGFQLDLSGSYFLTQLLMIGKYLQLTFIPAGQSLEHDFFWVRNFWRPDVAGSTLALTALIASCIIMAGRFRLAMFGVFWYLIYLFPTSSVFRIGTAIFEHRLYFSLPGFGIFITAVVFGLFGRRSGWRNVILAVLIAVLAVMAGFRNWVWRSPPALLEDSIKKNPNRPRLYSLLAEHYINEQRWDEAERLLRRGLALAPYYTPLYDNLGVALIELGHRKEGLGILHKAVRLDRKDAAAWWSIAHYYKMTGKLDLAAQYISEALALPPRARVFLEAGDIFLMAGRIKEAEGVLRQGMGMDRYNIRMRVLMGECLFRQGRYDEAEEYFRWCLKQDPDYALGFYGLGLIALKRGEFAQARDALEKARELEPRNAYFYAELSRAYRGLGDVGRADFYFDLSRTIRYRFELPEYKR